MSFTSAIIGFGNLLMGDEGVGVRTIEHLRNSDAKPNADLLDGGTGGMTLLHILDKYRHIIIIDAADFGGRPGEARIFALEDVSIAPDTAMVSLHGASLAGIIELARRLDTALPKITIIAVQPEKIAPGMRLSETCKTAINEISKLLNRVLA